MDKETIERVFEPFFTTKERGSGTGLGLATVYGIIKQARGYISVYSELGIGTTFKVLLPATTDGEGENPADVVALPDGIRTRTVLVVEDEDAVRLLVERILTRHGFTVLSAASGPEALDLMEIHLREIEVLLTDVVMPKMSGKDLAERARAMHPGIDVIYMSGYAESIIADHGVIEEGVNHLQKPFTGNELIAKLAELGPPATQALTA
jgi:CheY-like chemotaxis protein